MPTVKVALVQQHADADRARNLERALDALDDAASRGADIVCFAELAFTPFYPQARADADGTIAGKTRMVHITDYTCFHERGYYTPGDTGAPVFDTAHGRIGVAICYDRHYPEYMRALFLGDRRPELYGEWLRS